MVACNSLDSYTHSHHSHVESVFSDLASEARFCGAVPELSRLMIVKDPENVLNRNDINLVSSLEDQMLLATFRLMPVALRFALRRGYYLNWNSEENLAYIKAQEPWIRKSNELLYLDLGREPTPVEKSAHYSVNGGLQFFIYTLMKRPDKAVYARTNLHIPFDDKKVLEELAAYPIQGLSEVVLAA